MPGEIDFHAAYSLWFSRASLVEEFEVGDWRGGVYKAHPADVDSECGKLVCALGLGKSFGGMIVVRDRKPQLRGRVMTAYDERLIVVPTFSGGPAELKEIVMRELPLVRTR